MTPFPIGHAIDLTTLHRDPYPTFQGFIQKEPDSWVTAVSMWYVAWRQDVINLLADTDRFTVPPPHNLIGDTFGPCMLSVHGSDHLRYRRPFLSPFLPKTLRTHTAPAIEALAHDLVDAFADAGEVDLKLHFADRLSPILWPVPWAYLFKISSPPGAGMMPLPPLSPTSPEIRPCAP